MNPVLTCFLSSISLCILVLLQMCDEHVEAEPKQGRALYAARLGLLLTTPHASHKGPCQFTLSH